MDSASGSLRNLVQQFVTDLRAQGTQLIAAPFVAQSLVESMAHVAILDALEKEAMYIGTAQIARDVLRKMHDGSYDPVKIESRQDEMEFPESALLNEGYSVLRENEPVYVPRTFMSRADMEYVCAKFDALSGYFARASRALRADFERRNALAA